MYVAVLTGGRSPEHDVSLASAAQVLYHLDRDRHGVWPVWIDRAGRWWPSKQALAAGQSWSAVQRETMHGPLRPGAGLDWLLDVAGIEVVFPVLHGPYGEDGTVQGLLELSDVAFVGSGCAASAVAMDKLRTRQVYRAAGVPMAACYEPRTALGHADAATEFAAMRQAIGTPAFVKADASGSTLGVARVTSERELAEFLDRHRHEFRRWFAEQAVTGEEITVAVLGNTGDELQALPAIGIYPVADAWFTHDAKYRPGACEEIIPPRGMSPAAIAEAERLAVRCHELLVCDGMSRTDMIATPNGLVVLETNTIPGLTKQSLLPRAAAAAGLTFPALLERLLQLASKRHRKVVAPATAVGVTLGRSAEA